MPLYIEEFSNNPIMLRKRGSHRVRKWIAMYLYKASTKDKCWYAFTRYTLT